MTDKPTFTLEDVRLGLQRQLDWTGPNGRKQGTLTLPRPAAELVVRTLSTSSPAKPIPGDDPGYPPAEAET